MISGTGKRVAEAYDGVPAAAPRLHIVFSAAVSVRVVDDEAIEGADPVDTGVFRFTRSDPVDLDMIVDYAVAGSASPGGDYIALAGTATIPAGAHSVDVVVTALDDAEVEGSEDVVVTVLERPDYVVGSWPSASIRLLDDDMPTVTAAAADGVAVEGAEPPNEAVFSFVRSGPTDQELVVNYVVEGDATPGTDYAGLSGSVTIDAGASSADVPVSALDDIASEQPESVAITVVPGEGYQVGSPESASITIVDNDPILDLRVSGSRDDAEENAAGEVSRSSSDLELIFDPTNGDQVVGVRFAAVNVAPGTTITSAWLQFQTNDVSLDPASLTIEAEAADNATGFSGAAFDVSGRSRTLTSVSWAPPPWDTKRAAGLEQQTPDLAALVQEVVDRPGWAAGNAIAFIITGTGRRVAESYDGDPFAAPVLHIEHAGTESPANQPPVVVARADSVVWPTPAVLDGTATDDLFPDSPTGLTATWSQVSGPAPVSFADASALDTSATFPSPGIYELLLTVDDGELTTSDSVVLAARDPNEPVPTRVRAVAFGDYGRGCCGEAEVAALVESLAPDLIVTTGDNRYGNNIDYAVGQFFSEWIGDYQGAYGLGAPINRFFPALGNHDYHEVGGLDVYLDYFSLPGGTIPTSATSGTERYYDFVSGPVHFFVLNSNNEEPDGRSSTSPQAQWLQAQSAASTAPWQIVLMHHPPFSSGSHGSTSDMQWPFESWGVDAVFAGHDHNYERLAKGNIPYFVVGSGGAGLYSAAPAPDQDSQIFYDEDYGVVLIDACDQSISFEFHSVSAGLVDSYAAGIGTCSDLPVVSVAASDPVAAEQDGDPGIFEVTRSGPTDAALTVFYTVAGTATETSDFGAVGGQVTIPVGQTTATITVIPVDDTSPEPDETVELTLVVDPAYQTAAPPGDTATVTITDNDLPVVSVVASDPGAAEQGSDPGVFVVTRSGPTDVSLTVLFTVAGSATPTSDYGALGGEVTIPVGQATATVTVIPVDDTSPEPDETVELTLAADLAYQVAAPPDNAATVTITDNDLPVVSVVASDAVAAEQDSDPGIFEISRSGPTDVSLTVSFTVAGSASPTSDYGALGGEVTIPVGQATATVTVIPVDDTSPEPDETVELTLAADPAYRTAAPPGDTATVTITDNDLPVVSVVASDPVAAEQGSDPGEFVVTRSGPTDAALTVLFTVAGSATPTSDYGALGGEVTIPVGQATATITVAPVDDTSPEPDETVELTLAVDPAYQTAAPPGDTATVTIT
ncbi:MAG: metallophosphoesterase, partial [Acidimicrobiia bacterium]|nr:metallophosphoesterase [Acidimicrobiia bacterium]